MEQRMFILLCLLAVQVGIASAEAMPPILDCAHAVTTPDINACAQLELEKKELELNQTYQRVLRTFDTISKTPSSVTDKSTLKQQLINAQRLWVKFRKADCDATYTYWSDGTIRGAMYLSCMLEKTKTRISELQAYTSTD
jgi:uncharacterized protein YecT (DUF1311 family)